MPGDGSKAFKQTATDALAATRFTGGDDLDSQLAALKKPKKPGALSKLGKSMSKLGVSGKLSERLSGAGRKRKSQAYQVNFDA